MKKFEKSFHGYKISEVNQFVDDVIVRVEDMLNKMKSKDLEIERLTKELEHYKKMDDTLNRAIVVAEESATRLNETSVKESDIIISDAKRNANRIINDALLKAEHIEEESQRLRRNIIQYKRRMKDLVKQQEDIIDDLDKVDL